MEGLGFFDEEDARRWWEYIEEHEPKELMEEKIKLDQQKGGHNV